MKERIAEIYGSLRVHYGEKQEWWPAVTPFEVMVGAVLTQNTAWRNVEKAIANFGARLSPRFVSAASLDELKEIIRPAGFFNQKTLYLKALTAWFARYDYEAAAVIQQPLDKLREELLGVKGVGPETADSILLYAFDLPSFVVDAYTMRLCQRYPVKVAMRYSAIKRCFEDALPRDAALYNRCHALIVIHAKEHCRKKPLCHGCPLRAKCAASLQ